MEMKGIFGGVFQMLLYRVVTIFVFYCASASANLNDAITAAEERIQFCQKLEMENTSPFPVNDYFESLSKDNKIQVITYIWKLNAESCRKPAFDKVLNSMSALPLSEQKKYTVLYSFNKDHKKIKELDYKKIDSIREIYSQPFNGRSIIENLDAD